MNQKTLWEIDDYVLCFVDELNYGIYKIIGDDNKPLKHRKCVAFHGRLETALSSLLEKLVKNRIKNEEIETLTDISKTVKEEANKIRAFGKRIDFDNLRKNTTKAYL